MPKEKGVQLNQSLIDGITTLQELALSTEPVGSRELARRLNMEPTRVNRILQTLDHIGMARKTLKRKYTSGPGMHVLSSQALFASGLISKVIEPLETLRKYNLIVALGMLWRDHVSYFYHADPGMDTVNALGRIGLYPASKGGVGMALLAEHTDEYIAQLYQTKPIDGYEDELESLIRDVNEVRSKGYCYKETEQNNYTLAVAVGNPAFCGIALSGWIPNNLVADLIKPLKEVADVINSIPH